MPDTCPHGVFGPRNGQFQHLGDPEKTARKHPRGNRSFVVHLDARKPDRHSDRRAFGAVAGGELTVKLTAWMTPSGLMMSRLLLIACGVSQFTDTAMADEVQSIVLAKVPAMSK